MLSGIVADHHRDRTWNNLRADFLQMLAHAFGIGGGMITVTQKPHAGQMAPKI